MNKITGNGCPTYELEASVGQFYEDLDTGNVYECQSITNVADTVTYNWVLRAHGEHIDDHAEIFGGGGSAGGGTKGIVFTLDKNYNYSCNVSYEEFGELVMAGANIILIREANGRIEYMNYIGMFTEGEYDIHFNNNEGCVYRPSGVGPMLT